jgi:hypothetical protein
VGESAPTGWIFAGLGESQQHRLHPETHLAQLVEEQRAAVRLSHEAELVLDGAGETAPRVPKQLGLEQRLGNAAAVHRNERAAAPRALRVKQPSDHFLTRTRLAKDQHFGMSAGSGGDVVAKRDDTGAFSN